jgi:GNAT superfamily N-acetyltransferase
MVAAAVRRREEGLQPFDPYRHLKQVTDLVAQAFAGELGPGARHTLRRMQRIARWGGLSLWLMGLDASTWGSPGFVWIEEGRVVGNLSLRRTFPPGGWLIGNVAVAPEYRGRGIGRALMEAAVDGIRERGGSWVGLEVRESNTIACRLYEHIGFQTVGSTLELLRPADRPWPEISRPTLSWQRAGAGDKRALYRLAQEGLTTSHAEVLELRPSSYRTGWQVRLTSWLEGRRSDWWVVKQEGELLGAVHSTSRWPDRWHQVKVLVAPGRLESLGPRLAQAAVADLARRRPWEATALLAGPRAALAPVFTAAGFEPLRHLLQMRLTLSRRVRILS